MSWIARKAFVSQAVDEFQAKHPEITVKLELVDAINAQTQAVLWSSGDTDADVFIGVDPATTPNFVSQDYIMTMEELGLWDVVDKSNMLPGPLGEATFGGKTRYVPLIAEMNWFNVNTDMLKAAGIMTDDTVPVPESWNQINDWGRTLKATFGHPAVALSIAHPWSMVDGFYGAVQGLMGSGKYESDGVTLVTDSPEIRDILVAWKQAWDEDLVLHSSLTDGSAGLNAFAAGQIAMTYESNGRWLEKAEGLGGATAPMPMPGGLENGSLMWIAALAVPRATEAPELAKAFIAEVLSDDYQTQMMMNFGKGAVTRSAYQSVNDPRWDQIRTGLSKSLPHPMYHDFDQYYEEASDRLQAYITGQIDLDTCLAQMADVLDSIDRSIVE